MRGAALCLQCWLHARLNQFYTPKLMPAVATRRTKPPAVVPPAPAGAVHGGAPLGYSSAPVASPASGSHTEGNTQPTSDHADTAHQAPSNFRAAAATNSSTPSRLAHPSRMPASPPAGEPPAKRPRRDSSAASTAPGGCAGWGFTHTPFWHCPAPSRDASCLGSRAFFM
jgi:hypothetical protein